jgi:DNA invertase Pin-like site-specific DNA recombinase
MAARTFAYARVSAKDQDLSRQIHALTGYVTGRDDLPPAYTHNGPTPPVCHPDHPYLYWDKSTGKTIRRNGFDAVRAMLRSGDVLLADSIDRIGRDTREVLNTVYELKEAGVRLIIIGGPMPLDLGDSSPQTRMMLLMLSTLAEMELIFREDRIAGARIARAAKGLPMGRPAKLAPDQVRRMLRDLADGDAVKEVCSAYGISRATLYRIRAEAQAAGTATNA